MTDNATVEKYDVIVIGTGQGGKPLAVDFAKAGKKTAVIERRFVGGTCVNYGCTPTKTIIASGRVAHLAKRGGDYGVKTGHIDIDMRRVRERKRDIVNSFRGGIEKLFKKTDNLDWITGHAKFTGSKEIEVDTKDGKRKLSADLICINTGTRTRLPNIEGFGEVETLNSETIMELDEVPEHLLVMGGGYVGLEFGQLFRRFGSKVTIIQRSDQLLPREEREVGEAMAEILREDGIEVELETEVVHLADGEGHHLTVRTNAPQGLREYTCSHLLVAIGRIPNSDDLGLEAAGIEMDDDGYVKATDKLETNVDGVYVIGDVKGGPAFTHISYDDYRVLKANLLESGSKSITGRLAPYVVYTDPQLGRVGISEEEAKQAGKKIKIAKVPMKHVARALETDETRGFMKAVIDAETDHILGATILGVNGGEVMNMLQIAMMGELPYTALRDSALAHPSLGESLNTLFSSVKEA